MFPDSRRAILRIYSIFGPLGMAFLIPGFKMHFWGFGALYRLGGSQKKGPSQEMRTKKILREPSLNCGPRGGTGGVKPGSGVQRFWGPLGASEFDPSFQYFGVSETPSQRPLRAPERLSGPRGRLFRPRRGVSRGKKVGHSEAPERSRFPGCPLRVPTLGFLPSDHR